jgi:hypothetical protein
VPLATLFDDPHAAASPVSRCADRTTWRDPQSGYVRRNISPAGYPSPIRVVEVLLPPGANVAYETGARDVRTFQQIWVLEGCVEVTLGDDTYALAEDDCFAMELDAPMAYRNPSDRPAHYAVIIAADRGRPARR